MAVAAHLGGLGVRLGVALVGRRPAAPATTAGPLPAFTVLGPLHREADRVGAWIDAMRALDYPRRLLDVQVLLEHDDLATRRAAERHARRVGGPGWLRLVVVPPGGPRTKPNALQHGLAAARGDLLVVFDAEDVPERDQLRRAAAAFAALPPEVACLQAEPVVAAAPRDVLGRVMAADYRLWHGRVLPGLARLGAPVPLAGTSNHFRVAALRALGGWDPLNLTEDAELGFRLGRHGLTTRMLASRTIEDSTPPGVRAWVRQRSRWSQGFAQTWWQAARAPAATGGRRGAAWAHLILGGTLAVQLTTPLLWARALLGPRPRRTCVAALGVASAARLVAARLSRGRGPALGAAGALAPLVWLLEGLAAVRGTCRLATAPSRWETTDHPVAPRGQGSAAWGSRTTWSVRAARWSTTARSWARSPSSPGGRASSADSSASRP